MLQRSEGAMGSGTLVMNECFDAEIVEMRRFVLASFQASAAIFYWIDRSVEMRDVSLFGISPQSFTYYLGGMDDCDPLSVKRLVEGQKRVSTLQLDREIVPRGDYDRYQAYLCESRITDVLDFVFWSGETAFAGLGVLKTPIDPPFLSDQFGMAQSMQRYLEFNLSGHPRLKQQQLHQKLSCAYRLTDREIEVIQLLRCGYTNNDIAAELGIALTTVKTHVTRIFEKLGVENRTSMVSWINQIDLS
jgi:DNA-binding CsgD family transcriptional regulator